MDFVERQHIGIQFPQLLDDQLTAPLPTFTILFDVEGCNAEIHDFAADERVNQCISAPATATNAVTSAVPLSPSAMNIARRHWDSTARALTASWGTAIWLSLKSDCCMTVLAASTSSIADSKSCCFMHLVKSDPGSAAAEAAAFKTAFLMSPPLMV